MVAPLLEKLNHSFNHLPCKWKLPRIILFTIPYRTPFRALRMSTTRTCQLFLRNISNARLGDRGKKAGNQGLPPLRARIWNLFERRWTILNANTKRMTNQPHCVLSRRRKFDLFVLQPLCDVKLQTPYSKLVPSSIVYSSNLPFSIKALPHFCMKTC